MLKKIIYPVVCLVCLMLASYTNAETVWKDVGRGIRGSDFNAIALDPGNAERAYVSSAEAVYKTTDGGMSWRVVFSAGSTGNTINTIAFNAGYLYAGTVKGLYRSIDEGNRWERVFSSIGNGERGVLFVTVGSDAIFIGTGSGLFFSNSGGDDWEKGRNLPTNSAVHYIALAPSDGRVMYAAADNGIYKSMDRGAHWDRIYETNVPEDDDVLYESENGEAEKSAEIRSLVVSSEDISTVFAATSRGLLITRDSGRTWKRASSLGLGSRDIHHLAIDHRGDINAATDRGVFVYSMATNSWDNAFSGLGSSLIRYIAVSEEERLLWAAAEKGIFKTVKEQAIALDRNMDAEEIFLEFADEPTIEEIRRAAIIYADVHPSKIRKWRSAAARKAFLPDLKVDFDKNMDWQSSTYFYSTSSQKYSDDDITQGNDTGWSVSLTWELGELIWNNDQTSIDSRARYAVQLRDDLLNEVTRLYFERRRLQVAMIVSAPVNIREKLENEIRLQEITAGIDALTDSYLSKKLNKI